MRSPWVIFRRYRVFLSYAHEDKGVGEYLLHMLEGEGHDVFFDRTSLVAGESYTARIGAAIARADVFVFLISPASVQPGTFALTELRIAAEHARTARRGFIVGVMARETPQEMIPPLLRALTWLTPSGDLAAETTRVVADRRRGARRQAARVLGGSTVAVTAVGALGVALATREPGSGPLSSLPDSVMPDTALAVDTGAMSREIGTDTSPPSDTIRIPADENSAREAYYVGMRLLFDGSLADAETRFREAVRLAPDSVKYHDAVAFTLLRRGEPDEASRILQTAIRINPDYDLLYSHLADARLVLGDTLGAVEALRQFLDRSVIIEDRRAAQAKLNDLMAPR